MNVTRYPVDHIQLTSDEPFDEVAQAFVAQLGKYEVGVRNKTIAAGGDTEQAKSKIAEMEGPSGFMLFDTIDHGALLGLAGQRQRAIQYVVGNPLLALQMTQHDIRASLYAPLRVLIYENQEGKTCLEYDTPSSQFGQFANADVTVVANLLDQKLETLASSAIR